MRRTELCVSDLIGVACAVLSDLLVLIFIPMVLLLLLQANGVRQDPGPVAVSGRLPDRINIPHSGADERFLAPAVPAEAHQKCRASRAKYTDESERNGQE